jgi:hypothetical protein
MIELAVELALSIGVWWVVLAIIEASDRQRRLDGRD